MDPFDTMKLRFIFRATKFSMPDLDCWALDKLKIPESELSGFYQSFLEQLEGKPFNIYSIAENVNDYFKICSNIKRYMNDDAILGVEDVLDFRRESDGAISMALKPMFLSLIEPEYLPMSASAIEGFERRYTIEFT